MKAVGGNEMGVNFCYGGRGYTAKRKKKKLPHMPTCYVAHADPHGELWESGAKTPGYRFGNQCIQWVKVMVSSRFLLKGRVLCPVPPIL